METTRRRPIGVTILAVLAGIVAVLAGLHFLQAAGVLPYVVGPVSIRDFNLWYTLMWGLTLWVWVWLARMPWCACCGASSPGRGSSSWWSPRSTSCSTSSP